MTELWSELSCLVVPFICIFLALCLVTLLQVMLGTTLLRWFIRFVKEAWD